MKEEIDKNGLLQILALAIVFLIFSWPFEWLWNNVVFGVITIVNPISYWQSFGFLTMIFIMGGFLTMKVRK